VLLATSLISDGIWMTRSLTGLSLECRRTNVQPSAIAAGSGNKSLFVRLYEWLHTEGLFAPANAPWVEINRSITYIDKNGCERTTQVRTTNLSISNPRVRDLKEDYIEDGGKLRPLPLEEQRAIIKSLIELKNTEVTLIHLCALLTAAREQTILTIRLKHLKRDLSEIIGNEVRIACGPGTGIDTKHNVNRVLRVPLFLYEQLQIYVASDRAKRRRAKNVKGDTDEQYVFLTQHGKPFYDSREDRNCPTASVRLLKSSRTGQSLRTFITRRVLPLARSHLAQSSFQFRFHDLRATFGMNYVAYHSDPSSEGFQTLEETLGELQDIMWHQSIKTTLLYLNYERMRQRVDAAQEGWITNLKSLIADYFQKS
jgi:hypothetical protein